MNKKIDNILIDLCDLNIRILLTSCITHFYWYVVSTLSLSPMPDWSTKKVKREVELTQRKRKGGKEFGQEFGFTIYLIRTLLFDFSCKAISTHTAR